MRKATVKNALSAGKCQHDHIMIAAVWLLQYSFKAAGKKTANVEHTVTYYNNAGK